MTFVQAAPPPPPPAPCVQQHFIFVQANINSLHHKNGLSEICCLKIQLIFSLLLNKKLIVGEPMSIFMCQITSCTDRIYRHLEKVCSSIFEGISHIDEWNSEINSDGCEPLCKEMNIRNTKTLICCVCKHPKVSNPYFKQCVSNICDKITPGSDDVIIIGDMNCCATKSSLIKYICDVYG